MIVNTKDAMFVAKLVRWTGEGRLYWRVYETRGLAGGVSFKTHVGGREILLEAPGINALAGNKPRIAILDDVGTQAVHSISNNAEVTALYRMVHESVVGLDDYLDGVINSDDP